MTCAQGLLRLLWGAPKLECYGTGCQMCLCCKTTLVFGHLVSAEGVKPTTENVKAIADYVRPPTQSQLRRFLGMIQFIVDSSPAVQKFYRFYIRCLAEGQE